MADQAEPDRQRSDTPSSAPLPELDFTNHPFNLHLDFPTLNTDGSLDDLTAHESRQHTRTPPAALSTLGARVKMERRSVVDNMSESEGSFADSQYDMLDDLSEISNDDHETASLPSNTDEPRHTPADTESDTDSEEDSTFLLDTEEQSSTPPRPTSAQSAFHLPFAASRQPYASGHLVQSYASEDLDTPRQSTMPEASSSAARRSTLVPSDRVLPASKLDEGAHHILFVAERDMNPREMDLISIRVASCMDSSTNMPHRVVRMPSTPSGIDLMSPMAVYAHDKLSATVQHCIDAESRMGSSHSWQLRVLDADSEHSSIYTVGTHAKIDLRKPDIAVIYLDDKASRKRWFYSAYQAVRTLNVPVLVIHRPSVNHPLISKEELSKGALEMSDFGAMERLALASFIARLQGRETSSASTEKRTWVRSKRGWLSWSAFTPLISLLILWACIVVQPHQKRDPVLELSHRREGLLAALIKTTNSTNAAKDFDIEHLLPECWLEDAVRGPVSIGQCKEPLAAMQGLPPNHLVVSVSPSSAHPEVVSSKVYRSDGRKLEFNQTKLIEGVYDFTFPIDDAYGSVFVNIKTTKPDRNITGSHDFGSRILQRRLYEKATTDVSKTASKDLAVMRTTVKSITGKLSTEFGAGVWATKNVTTQLALHAGKELQTIGTSALSIFSKAAHVGNQTATAISKDFVLMQSDLAKFTKDLSTRVRSKMEAAKSTSKELIRSPISRSREQLMGFKKALQERKEAKRAARQTKKNVHAEQARSDVTTDAYVRASNAHKSLEQRIQHLSARVKKLHGQEGPRAGLKQLKKQLREHEKTIKSFEETAQKSYEEALRKKKEEESASV